MNWDGSKAEGQLEGQCNHQRTNDGGLEQGRGRDEK